MDPFTVVCLGILLIGWAVFMYLATSWLEAMFMSFWFVGWAIIIVSVNYYTDWLSYLSDLLSKRNGNDRNLS